MGKNIVSGIIARVERMGTSKYGNPYFSVHFEDGSVYRTQIDSMISYGIENSENIGAPVEVYLTEAGRIYDVKPVL